MDFISTVIITTYIFHFHIMLTTPHVWIVPLQCQRIQLHTATWKLNAKMTCLRMKSVVSKIPVDHFARNLCKEIVCIYVIPPIYVQYVGSGQYSIECDIKTAKSDLAVHTSFVQRKRLLFLDNQCYQRCVCNTIIRCGISIVTCCVFLRAALVY